MIEAYNPPIPPIGMATGSICPPQTALREISGSLISAAYTIMGVSMALVALIFPVFISEALFMMSPLWTVVLLLHTCSKQRYASVFIGVALIMVYPFFLFLQDEGMWALYFIIFTLFTLSESWREQAGIWAVLCVLCTTAILACAIFTLILQTKAPSAQCLQAEAGLSVVLAVTCTRCFYRFQFKVFVE
jgi:hypothetical protein